MFLDNEDDLLGNVTIEKHNDYFEIVFTKSYRCTISNYKEGYCLVEHINNGWLSDVYFISYEKLGAKNLGELFCLLMKKPREIVKLLTENDIPIDKLIVKYFDN